jgi:hypothetical protein
MNLKACDRCGAQFFDRDTFTVPYPPTGAELPKLQAGIKHLNKVTLPMGGKDKSSDNQTKEFHSFPVLDICAKCVLELEPVVAKWLAEK